MDTEANAKVKKSDSKKKKAVHSGKRTVSSLLDYQKRLVHPKTSTDTVRDKIWIDMDVSMMGEGQR